MGYPILLLVHLAAIKNDIPNKYNIAVEVQGIQTGKEGGLLGIQAENLKIWLREATREKNPIRIRWEVVISMIHPKFLE